MKKYITSLGIIMLALAYMGCESEEDFLDTDYNGVIAIKKVSDYELLLNDGNITSSIFDEAPYLELSDNYVPNPDASLSTASLRAYLWEETLYDPGEDPVAWTKPYSRIFSYNTILTEIDDASDASSYPALKTQIKAEALLGRAFEYWILQNLFAPPYDGTNGDALSVPFVEIADITIPIPERSTIDEINARIIADVEAAIPDLPDVNSTGTYRGSKSAAYAFLSRVYLFNKDYDKVIEYADLALAIKDNIDDFLDSDYEYSIYPKDDNQKVYSRPASVINQFLLLNARISSDLSALYFSNLGDFAPYVAADQRVTHWMFPYLYDTPDFGRVILFWMDRGISTPEIWLNKAEALVRTGDTAEGLRIVNEELRVKRIQDNYGLGTDLISYTNDPEEILGFVLDERRRELMIYTMRWFDMRRLQLEGRIGTVTHEYSDGTIATLEEGSDRYTLTIPSSVLDN